MAELAELQSKIDSMQNELHQVSTKVQLTAQKQETMQSDLTSISILLKDQKLKEEQFEESVRATLIRLEIKLAKWTGLFMGGYAVIAAAWVVVTFFLK